VGYEELKTWITYLNLDATLVSRNTIKRDFLKIFMKEKNMLKEEFKKISNRIYLTLSTPDFVRALMVFFPSAETLVTHLTITIDDIFPIKVDSFHYLIVSLS